MSNEPTKSGESDTKDKDNDKDERKVAGQEKEKRDKSTAENISDLKEKKEKTPPQSPTEPKEKKAISSEQKREKTPPQIPTEPKEKKAISSEQKREKTPPQSPTEPKEKKAISSEQKREKTPPQSTSEPKEKKAISSEQKREKTPPQSPTEPKEKKAISSEQKREKTPLQSTSEPKEKKAISSEQKREKTPPQSPTEPKEKRKEISSEQNAQEPKRKHEKSSERRNKSADQPSTSAKARSKERNGEQTKRAPSGQRKDSKAKEDESHKRDIKNKHEHSSRKRARKKKSESLRKYMSAEGSLPSRSFHSPISSPYASLSDSSLFVSSLSVDPPVPVENAAPTTPPRLGAMQRLTQYISSFYTAPRRSTDIGVQTSDILLQQPPTEPPQVRAIPSTYPNVPLVETSTVAEEQKQSSKKKRFFESSSHMPLVAKEDTGPKIPASEQQKQAPRKKPSADTVGSQPDGVDSVYDNDKGGYATEVDDDIDDSLKRRIEKRKEAAALHKVDEQPSLNLKKGSRTHSLLSRLETNLRTGTAFIYMVIPPDRGFAWIIVFMSFLSQLIVDGIIFSVGIVLPNIAKDLQVNTSQIALMCSIQIGPITSAFINKFGFRMVAMTGVTLGICTLFIASFSPNLSMLIVFYSIIGGPALSMIWVSSQLIIGYYFEKYRPIANGISCAGAGAGVVVFSFLNGEIVEYVYWRNIMRIHIAILCLVILLALTFVEVKPTRIAEMPDVSETDSEEDIEHLQASNRYSRPDMFKSFISMKKGLGDNLVEITSDVEMEQGRIEKCLTTCCPAFGRYEKEHHKHMHPLGPDRKRFVIRADPLEKQDIYYTGPARYEARDNISITDIAGADVRMLSQHRHSTRAINYTLSMINMTKKARDKKKGREREQSVILDFLYFISPANWLPVKVKRAFRILFDFKLLREMEFKVLCLSAVLFSTGFNIPFVYSKERAQVAVATKILISPTIGLSNLVFRIACGFVAYRYREYTTYLCGSGIFFGGFVTFISGFYGEDVVWFQFFYATCYGVAPAFYSTLRSIIYVRCLGLQNLTTAFGITAMGMGLGVFIGTSVGAVLYQLTGGFTASFAFSGCCIMMSGTLKLIIPYLIKWKNEKNKKQETNTKNKA